MKVVAQFYRLMFKRHMNTTIRMALYLKNDLKFACERVH